MTTATTTPEQRGLPGNAYKTDHARRYDDTIRRVIPGYDALHSMTGVLLRDAIGDDGRILVVGAGTGAELLALGEMGPQWRFTACDPAPDMLAVARERLAGHPVEARAALHACIADDLPAGESAFDAATCLLVMHFLPDDGSKLALLKSIAARLKPGAPLILADMHEDPASERWQRILRAWAGWQKTNGIDPVMVERGLEHVRRSVHFVPRARLEALFDEAGFEPSMDFWHAFQFGAFLTRRKAEAAA